MTRTVVARLLLAAVVLASAAWFVSSGQFGGPPVDVRHDRLNCGHVGVHCPSDRDCVSTMCLPAAPART